MIALDSKQLDKVKKMLGNMPGAVEKAVVATLNKAITSAKGDAAKHVAKNYVIQSKRVRETIGIQKANKNNLSARIVSRGRPRALSYFKTRPTDMPRRRMKKRVWAQVKKGGGSNLSKKTFITRFKSGHLAVVSRVDDKKRFPLVQHYGPAISQMLNANSVVEYVENKALERVDKLLNHEIDRIAKGYGQ